MPDIGGVKQEKAFITMNRLILLLTLFGLPLLLLRCGKNTDNGNDFFPPQQFRTQLNLNLPQYMNLTFPQGYVYIPEGNKGSVVYRLPQGGFVVYDRTCSYNPDAGCAQVTVDSNYAGLKCGSYNNGFQPCCQSIFDLNTGVPTQKPANRSLRQYFTSFDEGQKILYISSTPF